MRMFVVHNGEGVIRSVIQAEFLPDDLGPDGPQYTFGDPGAGEVAVELPAEGIAVELNPLEIQENYRFDVEAGALARKDEG